MSKFALILLWIGLLFPIPVISAQENQSEILLDQEVQTPVEERLRIAEQSMLLDESTAGATTASGPSVWAAIRMVLVLALAAAAIYGVIFFIKRSAKPASATDPFLKILASSHLGSNRYAHIVSVGGRAWLLGSSDGGVSLIDEIVDNDVINAMMLEDSRKSTDTLTSRFPDFVSILRRLGAPAESHTPGTDDIRKRRERLKGL